MNPLSIGIVGCGWLGKALLQQLIRDGHQVIATYRTEDNKHQLQQLGAIPERLELPLPANSQFNSLNQDVVIISIPPKLRHSNDYPNHIKQLVQQCEQLDSKHLILVSSTAIYNGLTGQVDEHSQLNLDGDKVAALLAAEQYVAEFSKQSSVIRFAGLLGPGRHPSRFVKADRIADNGQNAVNLIHQQDAVGLLKAIINTTNSQSNTTSDIAIYNGVSATHCSRQTFYQAAATSKHLTAPQFSNRQIQASREVRSDISRQRLQYQFIYDDLLAWLNQAQ